MHFTTNTLLALLSAPLLALAQSANPFSIPEDGLSATAGEPLTLNWEPTTDSTVTLVLRSGSSSDLEDGTVIASSIDNSGSYTWTPSDDLTRGSDYTIEIVDDANPENTNYTPYFVLDSDNTTPQTTDVVTSGAPTSSVDLSTASATGDATSVTAASASASATETETDSAASTASDSSATASASDASSTAESSASSSASEAASSASASASEDLSSPQQSDNAGTKKTAMVGMLGAVALGAFAL